MNKVIGLCVAAVVWLVSKYVISFVIGFVIGFLSLGQNYSLFVIIAYAVDVLAIIPAIIIYKKVVH